MCSSYVWLLALSIMLSKVHPYCSIYQYFLSLMSNIPVCAYIPFSLFISGVDFLGYESLWNLMNPTLMGFSSQKRASHSKDIACHFIQSRTA